jgi:hypothetical protein
MSDKNNMNFYIINIEYLGKIINLIQIITFFHIYIHKANPPFKVKKKLHTTAEKETKSHYGMGNIILS